jgi:hypothetical protein
MKHLAIAELREYIDLTAQVVVGTFYPEVAIERVRSNPRYSDEG